MNGFTLKSWKEKDTKLKDQIQLQKDFEPHCGLGLALRRNSQCVKDIVRYGRSTP